MNKKLLVSVLLCFFVFSLGMLAKEKTHVIEFLAREHIFNDNFYEFIPNVSTQGEDFDSLYSGVFLTLHVPPSPKSEGIFFYQDAQVWYKWTNHEVRIAHAIIWVELKSDIIPEDIIIYNGMTIVDVHETNIAGDYTLSQERSWRDHRFLIKRDYTEVNLLGELRVWYKGGGDVPNEIAIPLINSLINNGFYVEISIAGTIKGVEWFKWVLGTMEVTRLVEK